MDNVFVDRGFRHRYLVVDIESGTASAEVDLAEKLAFDTRHPHEKLLNRARRGFTAFDGLKKVENPMVWECNLSNSVVVPVASGELVGDAGKNGGEESAPLLENKVAGEGSKKKKIKNHHPKPPIPPKNQSLEIAERKLIQEISELAVLKRARIERMKALKTLKNAKVASSSSNPWALAITILCCLLVIWEAS